MATKGTVNNLGMETRTYHIVGTTDILGSSPCSKELRTQYIMAEAAKTKDVSDETDYVPDLNEKGLTVFLRDTDGSLMMMDYQIQGFLKAALDALKAQNGIKNARKKVDLYAFVTPRKIPFVRNGEHVAEEDEQYERPLRAMTMKGERIALQSSECLHADAGWELTFSISLMPNDASKVSKSLKFDDIEQALDYGQFSGLSQFHNGGYGRFRWERVKDEANGDRS